ncbi:MAG TPA: D-alanyl-D-alanine carboxypeptidase family protein [Steroidobacteraceae bacterium]|jgi:D-alanyl-D-alanine carboxypeptidase (penicillin-binding protein 5/6)|nr:D-alanyl-D-alanine carboxypeptidase family protein [Steroidobacteraceae bacterium]
MSRSPAAALLALSTLALATTAGAAVPTPPPPDLDAGSYIVIDHQSGDVVAQKNADQRMEPASLTKLMTAYVVFSALRDGRLKLDDPVTISEDAWRTGGSRTFVKVGSQVPVIDLIKGMIVQSGNDATVALSERVGGTRAGFVQLMNEYAQRLGMKSSHFADVDGLPDPQHYMTARDLATVANALIRDFPEYYYIFGMKDFTWNKIKQPNRNGLLWTDTSVDGLKTGHTDEAGYCLIASADRKGMRLVSVVLHAPTWHSREADTEALLNYGFNFFQTEKIATARAAVLKPRVYESASGYAAIGAPANLYVTLPRGQAASVTTNAALTKTRLIAPLAAGTVVGELTVTDGNGHVVGREPLVTLEAVPAGGLLTRTMDGMRLWFH